MLLVLGCTQWVSNGHGFNNANTKPKKVRLETGGYSCACLDASEAMSKQVLKDANGIGDPGKYERKVVSLGHGAR